MRFRLRHAYTADPDQVAAAYASSELYDAFEDLPRAAAPEVLERTASPDGRTVRLRVRWRFAADLAPAARAVVDPAKLTWVEESTHDLDARTVSWVLRPDHYKDRFSGQGTYRFEAAGTGTERVTDGELRIKAPLVARVVENAIVSGLDEQLDAEVQIVQSHLGT